MSNTESIPALKKRATLAFVNSDYPTSISLYEQCLSKLSALEASPVLSLSRGLITGNMCQALISNKQRVPSYLLTSTITCVEPTPLTASSRTLSALSTSIPPLNFEELIPPPTDVQEAAARVRDVHGQAGLKIIVKGYYRRGSARLIDQFEDEDCEPCVDLAAALSDFIVAYQICTLSSSYPATSEEEKQIGQLNKTITDAFKTCCARISVDGGLPMPPSKHEQKQLFRDHTNGGLSASAPQAPAEASSNTVPVTFSSRTSTVSSSSTSPGSSPPSSPPSSPLNSKPRTPLQQQKSQLLKLLLQPLPPTVSIVEGVWFRGLLSHLEFTNAELSSLCNRDKFSVPVPHALLPKEACPEPLPIPAFSASPYKKLTRNYDYYVLPPTVYTALSDWYGSDAGDSPPLLKLDSLASKLHAAPSSAALDSQHPTPKCSCCDRQLLKPFKAIAKCGSCSRAAYCDAKCQTNHWKIHKKVCKNLKLQAIESEQSRSNSQNTLYIAPKTRPGLANLGNTCYMNTVLQCLFHVAPLTQHFVSSKFKDDLNCDNVMGSGGKIANSYSELVKEMRFGNERCVMPRDFKLTCGRANQDFANMQQHDSTEFLTWLCDQLHEDLNKIKKKPFVEDLDCDNSDVDIHAANAWDGFRLRNESILVDCMYGQFQSTRICAKCKKVTVKFDPFNNLNLSFPENSMRVMTVGVWRWRGGDGVVGGGGKKKGKKGADSTPGVSCLQEVSLRVKKEGSIQDVRRELCKTLGLKEERIMFMEMYSNNFYQELYQDPEGERLSTIQNTDVLTAYEVHDYETEAKADFVHCCFVQRDSKRDTFGFPIVTSFDKNHTCTELRWHIWGQVKRQFDWAKIQEYIDEGKLSEKQMVEEHLPLEFCQGFKSMTTPGHREEFADIPASEDVFSTLVDGKFADNMCYFNLNWSNEWLEFMDESSLDEVLEHESVKVIGRQGENVCSLEEMLECFGNPERLSLEDNYYCGECKEFREALLTIKLRRLPNILVVGFKRFKYRNEYRTDKQSEKVQYPIEGLDMARFQHGREEREECVYDLCGAVLHYGRAGFGHYVALARNWESSGRVGPQGKMTGNFFHYDDGNVQEVKDMAQVVSEHAYCLFYRRRVFFE